MGTYSIAEAKDQLSKLINEANDGADVTITRHGKPVATIKPVESQRGKIPKDLMDRLERLRAEFPPTPGMEDSVTILRRMRDDED